MSILLDKWKEPSVTGVVKPEKPDVLLFNNSAAAMYLLYSNTFGKKNPTVAIHSDVDVDGIGSTYIMYRVLQSMGVKSIQLIINGEREHGIKKKHADFFRGKKIDLMIILDSSTNETEIIKQFECDVLVIDHHDILTDELQGKTNDGHNFVVINNLISGESYDKDIDWISRINKDASERFSRYSVEERMSCGLVTYEFLRAFCLLLKNESLLENLLLYQVAVITLYTDAISMLNERNQWYISRTIGAHELERNLSIMLPVLNKWESTISKSFIGFSLGAIVNCSIRAGAGAEVLRDWVLNPENIGELSKYQVKQREILKEAINPDEVFDKSYILKDVTSLGVGKGYCGVIAMKLCSSNKKNVAAYVVKDKEHGIVAGSFRGRQSHTKYRNFFEEYSDDIYAQGHPPAFGFELKLSQLKDIMEKIDSIETVGSDKFYLTIGHFDESEKGIHHYDDFNDFKRQGLLWQIGVGNSHVASDEEIDIVVKTSDVRLAEAHKKYFVYDVLGVECRAFEPISGQYAKIYAEYSSKLELFIRNI